MPKSTSLWYTPDHILKRVLRTFNHRDIYDPCPMGEDVAIDGLKTDWTDHRYVYCNPPIPAALWAYKALSVVEQHGNLTTILFAAFSPSVFFQEPRLLRYPTCYVRHRIKWIDGRSTLAGKSVIDDHGECVETRIPNPRFMQSMVGSTQYSAFVLMGGNVQDLARFKANFQDIGAITPGY